MDAPEDAEGEALDEDELKGLCDWMKEHLGDKVDEVRKGSRLVDSPVMALNADPMMTPQMRHMMKSMGQDMPASKVHLELNPRHELVKRMAAARESKPDLAAMIVDQVFDNAMIAAGLLEDSKDLVSRIYRIMEEALDGGAPKKEG